MGEFGVPLQQRGPDRTRMQPRSTIGESDLDLIAIIREAANAGRISEGEANRRIEGVNERGNQINNKLTIDVWVNHRARRISLPVCRLPSSIRDDLFET